MFRVLDSLLKFAVKKRSFPLHLVEMDTDTETDQDQDRQTLNANPDPDLANLYRSDRIRIHNTVGNLIEIKLEAHTCSPMQVAFSAS
jgi:hypothetical protein